MLYFADLKGVGVRDQVTIFLEISLTGCDKNSILAAKYHEKHNEDTT